MTTVNVVPGACGAARVKDVVGGSEQVLAIDDYLSLGPLIPMTSDDRFSKLRTEFWREVLPENPHTFEPRLPSATSLALSESITLWLGTGPNDQLALAWVCQQLGAVGYDLRRLKVIQFPPGTAGWHRAPSLGILSPPEVQAHPPAVSLREADIAVIEKAWNAVTSDTPDLLVSFMSGARASPLPVLVDAVSQLFSRYPDVKTGLSRWDLRLLCNSVGRGPRVIKVIAHTLAEANEDRDPVGDAWLYWRLRRLSSKELGHPLLQLSADLPDYKHVTVESTQSGNAVVDGTSNALDLNGINDWVCGVHLDSQQGQVWQRNGEELVLARR
jgi:hypothetical protein